MWNVPYPKHKWKIKNSIYAPNTHHYNRSSCTQHWIYCWNIDRQNGRFNFMNIIRLYSFVAMAAHAETVFESNELSLIRFDSIHLFFFGKWLSVTMATFDGVAPKHVTLAKCHITFMLDPVYWVHDNGFCEMQILFPKKGAFWREENRTLPFEVDGIFSLFYERKLHEKCGTIRSTIIICET